MKMSRIATILAIMIGSLAAAAHAQTASRDSAQKGGKSNCYATRGGPSSCNEVNTGESKAGEKQEKAKQNCTIGRNGSNSCDNGLNTGG